MKAFKFWIAFFAASLSANSQLAWASMTVNQKAAFNKAVKTKFSGTFNEIYQKNAHLYDEQSRSILEAWLKNYGQQKASIPQAQIVKDKNGKESVKMILSHAGKTVTLTFAEGNTSDFDLNGTRVSYSQIRNVPSLIAALEKKDVSYSPLHKSLQNAKTKAPKKSDTLTLEQFAALKPIQRVEYLMLLRQNLEAAQEVMNDVENKNQASASSDFPSFALHPLIASQIAWAQSIQVGKTKCLVAGNISVYEKNKTGRPYCTPFPKSVPGTLPMPSYHHQCDKGGKAVGQGDVSCPPMLYGTRSGGTPYCQWSSDQPTFTQKATERCNNMSPLHADKDSKERRAQYEKILKDYYSLNGGDGEKIKNCFNNEHKLNIKCKEIFEPQYNAFLDFKKDADKVCANAKKLAKDQPHACEELAKRALDLATFIEEAEVMPSTPVSDHPVNGVDARRTQCERNGYKWDEKLECLCPDGKKANYNTSNEAMQYECPIAQVTEPEPVEKDECKDENGQKSTSFECNAGLWLGIGLAVLGIIWLTRDKDKPSPGPGPGPGPGPENSSTTLPNTGTTVLTPTTTQLIPPTTMAPSGEGGSGQSNGTTGGARGAK